MSEHEIQVAVFDVLRLNESKYPFLKWIYAIPNGGHRHPAVAGKLKAEGVKRGISDICLPFPSLKIEYPQPDRCTISPKNFGCYIEMKDGNKKPTEHQAAFIDFLRTQNYLATVAQSADEALDVIEDYCGIKLRGRR